MGRLCQLVLTVNGRVAQLAVGLELACTTTIWLAADLCTDKERPSCGAAIPTGTLMSNRRRSPGVSSVLTPDHAGNVVGVDRTSGSP